MSPRRYYTHPSTAVHRFRGGRASQARCAARRRAPARRPQAQARDAYGGHVCIRSPEVPAQGARGVRLHLLCQEASDRESVMPLADTQRQWGLVNRGPIEPHRCSFCERQPRPPFRVRHDSTRPFCTAHGWARSTVTPSHNHVRL